MDAAVDRFGLSGTTLAGRYRVERQVAEGGFAFNSDANDLGPTDTNGAPDVYVRASDSTQLVSMPSHANT